MNHSGKLRNMASVYIRSKDKLLLLYRQGNSIVSNLWIGSAGGHFKPDECCDAKACMLRELNEELGLGASALCNLTLCYITLRYTDGEVRQNYYFFADLNSDSPTTFSSTEGICQWFSLEDTLSLSMPITARHVIDHYIKTGQHTHDLYGAIVGKESVAFEVL